LSRKGKGEHIPAVVLHPQQAKGTVVIWVHSDGMPTIMQDGKFVPAARQILDKGATILAADVFFTRPTTPPPAVNPGYAGYTFAYNRPLLANRVHDILTLIAYAQGRPNTKAVSLVGFNQAGPWVLLARALGGEAIARTAVDVNRFRFDSVTKATDEMMLPGALKYSGLPALVALCAPGELYLHNDGDAGTIAFARDAYQAAGMANRLQQAPDKVAPEQVVQWLLR
jgi:hypothetical protein